MHELIFTADQSPQSLERFVATTLGYDHRQIRRWIQAGHILVEGAPAKATRYLQPGQRISVVLPPPQAHPARPEALALPIRYLDADLIVVAKPAGMATHPGPGWWSGSCVNALLHSIEAWPGIGGVAGPGIVHRLDRDTSGLLVFARSEPAHRALLTAAREQTLEREYLAIVCGRMQGIGRIEAPLGRQTEDPTRMAIRSRGKHAVTHYRALCHWQLPAGRTLSLLKLRLETGRTHQIRVHLASIGFPIWGDPVYGSPGRLMALHAWRLAFAHPLTGAYLDFTEPLPRTWPSQARAGGIGTQSA